jgi:endo-1,4-beta-xylanase
LGFVVASLAVALNASAQNQASSPPPTLKDSYKGCFMVGAALNAAQFSGQDQVDGAIIKAQFNSISPENVLKWESVHPRPNEFDFSLADKYVEFGDRNRMFIIGHNLVWHSQVTQVGVQR